MPVLVMPNFLLLFLRLALFRDLGLRALSCCQIRGIDSETQDFQFDRCTSPIDCVVLAVATKVDAFPCRLESIFLPTLRRAGRCIRLTRGGSAFFFDLAILHQLKE